MKGKTYNAQNHDYDYFLYFFRFVHIQRLIHTQTPPQKICYSVFSKEFPSEKHFVSEECLARDLETKSSQTTQHKVPLIPTTHIAPPRKHVDSSTILPL